MQTIKIKDRSELPINYTGIVEFDGSIIVYFKNGYQHRLDGPAYYYPYNGYREWWINGLQYTTAEAHFNTVLSMAKTEEEVNNILFNLDQWK